MERRIAAGLFATLAVAAGCSEKAPFVVPGSAPAGSAAAPADSGPVGEADLEAAAYFKAKGWELHREVHPSGGRPFIGLYVPGDPASFKKVPLAAADYVALARSKTVEFLNLIERAPTDEGVAALAGIPTLRGIHLGGPLLTDAGVKALAGAANLEFVCLVAANGVTGGGVAELGRLPKLRSLSLNYGLRIDGPGLAAFADSKTLRELELDGVEGFGDAEATHVAKIPGLAKLRIRAGIGRSNLRVTPAGLQAIIDARVPPTFDFDARLLTDASLASLVAKGWLYGPGGRTSDGEPKPARAAEVCKVDLAGSKVTDEGFKALAGCTGLTTAFLQGSGVGDGALKQLASCRGLTHLNLGRTEVTAAGLGAVAGLPIDSLKMDNCSLNEDHFRVLGRMLRLETLGLAGAALEPAWLSHLGGLSELRDLDLSGTALDDGAFARLAGLPKLRTLRLDDTRVSRAAYRQAQERFPAVRFAPADSDRPAEVPARKP